MLQHSFQSFHMIYIYTYMWDGLRVRAFLAFVTTKALLRSDCTKSSRVRGKILLRATNGTKQMVGKKTINAVTHCLAEKQNQCNNVQDKDIDYDRHSLSYFSNLFVSLHYLLYAPLKQKVTMSKTGEAWNHRQQWNIDIWTSVSRNKEKRMGVLNYGLKYVFK